MTKQLPVSTTQNLWHDAQRVDKSDLDTEQLNKNQNDAAIVNNFFGSGVLPKSAQQNIIFDSTKLDAVQASLLAAGNFDGYGISPHSQPSDNNLGNQLEVVLSNSDVFGRLSVKVLIIGLSFDDQLKMDRIVFNRNGTQTTSNHYKRILSLLFNDFRGNNNCSVNNGGDVIVREAKPFQLSKDPVMVSQDIEPDLFFRDFKVSDVTLGLFNTLQNAIGSEFDADHLNINITGQPARFIEPNDTTTQIGQKFRAKTNNIQKITLLLGARRDDEAAVENRFDWSGDLIVTLYKLQTTVSCPTDIIPELAIEFDPDPIPIAEISFSQVELRSAGYILTDIAQPVDFVFNNTSIANPGGIIPGNHYAVTFRRSGSTATGAIFAEVGTNKLEDSRLTVFSGVWTDVVENDLWFQIWTDAAKIADGSGYENGNGMQFPKTVIDTETGSTIDNQKRFYSFSSTGQNTLNTGILQAIKESSLETQDERTGNNIFSRQQFIPQFSFLTSSKLAELSATSEPLIIGCVSDNNPKNNSVIIGTQKYIGAANGDVFTIFDPDPDLLSQQLVGSKLIPNTNKDQFEYRIFKVEVCEDGYGDITGNGTITQEDIARASALIGEGPALSSTQEKIRDGYIDIREILVGDVNGDGYVTAEDVDLITQFVNKEINSFPIGTSFTRLVLHVQPSVGRDDGYHFCGNNALKVDGYNGNVVSTDTFSAEELLYLGNPTIPTITVTDSDYQSVPFSSIEFRIEPQLFWKDYLLSLSSNAREVPAAFINTVGAEVKSCSLTSNFTCTDQAEQEPDCDPGRTDIYFPNNIIIGNGQILDKNGDFYKNDLEIVNIILNLPITDLQESSINIFEKLLKDNGLGKTSGGSAAARYADCSTVQSTDLALNKIRFSVSIQSYYKIVDGYTHPSDGYHHDNVGISIDHSTGILTLNTKNLAKDNILDTLVTKVQITAFLKKAGWNNSPIIIDSGQIAGLIS